MKSGEKMIRVDQVRRTQIRARVGDLEPLRASIQAEGLHQPITVWTDGTLISGERRLRAYWVLGREHIQGVFVGTIEDAAKRLVQDVSSVDALPMTWSEICRLWQLLRRLDEPAAARRATENQRRGILLRRQTQAGLRKPGRSNNRTDDYVLRIISEPFGFSAATAARVETIYRIANGPDSDKRELAREAMTDLDNGAPVWPAHQRVMGVRTAPPSKPRPATPAEPAPAARQRAAWDRSLPQLEGLVAGLIELGPVNPELSWEQVGPVHTRLMATRRELEKIIKQMRESSKS